MKGSEYSELTDLINTALYDKAASSSRYESLEDLLEVLRNLLERPFDGLVLSLIQYLNQLFDRLCRSFQVLFTFKQLVALFREVVVLLESLLVDVRKLLEALVNRVELLHELKGRRASVHR